jgi:hypothetical protein
MQEEDSSPIIRYPDWQSEYQAAILETDRKQLAMRIAGAESAIAKRLQALSQSADHRAELHAIGDALAALRTLKEEL